MAPFPISNEVALTATATGTASPQELVARSTETMTAAPTSLTTVLTSAASEITRTSFPAPTGTVFVEVSPATTAALPAVTKVSPDGGPKWWEVDRDPYHRAGEYVVVWGILFTMVGFLMYLVLRDCWGKYGRPRYWRWKAAREEARFYAAERPMEEAPISPPAPPPGQNNDAGHRSFLAAAAGEVLVLPKPEDELPNLGRQDSGVPQISHGVLPQFSHTGSIGGSEPSLPTVSKVRLKTVEDEGIVEKSLFVNGGSSKPNSAPPFLPPVSGLSSENIGEGFIQERLFAAKNPKTSSMAPDRQEKSFNSAPASEADSTVVRPPSSQAGAATITRNTDASFINSVPAPATRGTSALEEHSQHTQGSAPFTGTTRAFALTN